MIERVVVERIPTPGTVAVERVPTIGKLSDMQFAVTLLAGHGMNYREMAEVLKVEPSTAKYHAEEAAKKIPGDLGTLTKLAMWARGAPMSVLDGTALRVEIVTRGHGSPGEVPRRKAGRPPLVAVAEAPGHP